MDPNAAVIPRAASWTALAVRTLVAIHNAYDSTPRVLDDPVAELLVGPEAVARARAKEDSPAVRLMRGHLVLRSRYAEDRLREAVEKRGAATLIILGAGLETFSYRQPLWARNLRVLEVDHPTSQADKRARLAAARIDVPSNVEFIPIDFMVTTLAAGLGPHLPVPRGICFFLWLGVMMYLPEGAIDNVFTFIASCPRGSEVAFSYSGPNSGTRAAFEAGGGAEAQAAAVGEPWLSTHTQEDLAPRIEAHGFSSVDFLSVEDSAKYFVGREDGLPPPISVRIGAAIV